MFKIFFLIIIYISPPKKIIFNKYFWVIIIETHMSMYNQGLWENVNTSAKEETIIGGGGGCTMEWTREKTLELLKEYQARHVLWDCNTRGYRDRTKRKKAIQELADILGCNTLEVEKKVTNLKCQYSREVHKIQNSKENANTPDDLYVSKWFAFKSMQFLQFGTRRYRRKKVEFPFLIFLYLCF